MLSLQFFLKTRPLLLQKSNRLALLLGPVAGCSCQMCSCCSRSTSRGKIQDQSEIGEEKRGKYNSSESGDWEVLQVSGPGGGNHLKKVLMTPWLTKSARESEQAVLAPGNSLRQLNIYSSPFCNILDQLSLYLKNMHMWRMGFDYISEIIFISL